MTHINSYLRMAMTFGDNNVHSFLTNLEQMVEMVLFDSEQKGLVIDEIVEELSNKYELKFSDSEVNKAIEKQLGRRIRCINEEVERESDKKYILSNDAQQEIECKTKQTSVEDICDLFLKDNSDCHIEKGELEKLILRYFYHCFNDNAATITQLMDGKVKDEEQPSENEEFTEEEKGLINTFIYWDNEEKDQFVYRMVACCFDYCTINAQADETEVLVRLKEKVFVLDTNILFRIMGINKNERKHVLTSFISKCKEVGVTLAVTDITKAELIGTINRHVDHISSLIGNTPPMNPSLLKGCENLDGDGFYEYYRDWYRRKGLKWGNISEFREDLLKLTEKVCSDFKKISYTSYEVRKPSDFETYVQDLKSYKSTHKMGHTTTESVKTDVNNLLYVNEQNETIQEPGALGLTFNHISADHHFSRWAKKIRPGSIPSVILPSIWYSIILHYTGRSTDDYSTFTRFLYLSLSQIEELNDEKRVLLLRKVSKLNEPVDVKEEIMYDVGRRLAEDYKDVDDELLDTLIAEARETATEKRVNEAINEKEREKQAALEVQMTETKSELNKLAQKHECEMNLLKAELHRVQDKNSEEIRELKEESQREVLKTKNEAQTRIINKVARRNARRKRRKYIIWFSFLIIVALVLIGFACIKLFGKEKVPEGTGLVITIVLGSIGLLSGILAPIFLETWFCKFDLSLLTKREKEELEELNTGVAP